MAIRRSRPNPGRALRFRPLTRREFLRRSAGAGLLLGLPPLLASCRDDGAPAVPDSGGRTLFFNLAHADVEHTTHWLVGGGHRYELVKVSTKPQVLRDARRTNAFLAAVPDDQITHHVENAVFADDITTLAYIRSVTRTPGSGASTGAWSMTMIVQHLPTSGVQEAYARARLRTTGGPLPLSVKRQSYGHPPATTALDLIDEQSLIDSSDHARTLLALHPDLLCVEPTGAQHIATSHIGTSSSCLFLALALRTKGAAAPQQTPGQPNSTGWATLVPIVQDDGQPFKTSDNFNQYFPDWDSGVDKLVADGVGALHGPVKDDPSLGADITSTPSPSAPIAALAGNVWYRHDGIPTVAPGNAGATPTTLKWDFRQKHGREGLVVHAPVVTPRADGRVLVALPDVLNWFLRFLGLWVQFADANGKVIAVSQLPPDTVPNQSPIQRALDQPNAAFLGVLPPPYTLAGIPVYASFASPTFVIPLEASSASFFLSGLGLNGSWNDPDGIIMIGALMTGLVNFGLVALFAAAGVSTLDAGIKAIAAAVSGIVSELVTFVGALFSFRERPTAAVIIGWAARLVRSVLNAFVGPGLVAFVRAIATQLSTAQVIDAAPVVGQIARAVAAVVGGVQLVESTIEVGVSPPIYRFDLTLTHDLNVAILPDPLNNQFPQVPAGYTLYYKVTVLFDDGTPYVLDNVVVPDATVRQITVTIPSVPRGGKVNISVGFYARRSSTAAGQNDWCAGKGTTGLVDNVADQAPAITIEQFTLPIQAATRYIHTRKTQLDAQGRHVWSGTAPAPRYIVPPGGQVPGNLGGFRNITVRQATATQPGFVGYAWQAYSRGLLDCTARAAGQLDQAANLNTDAGNGGANAQNGYVTTPCALQGGATNGLQLAYNLLGDDRANLYLDTSTLHVRPVTLAPPGFATPASGMAFGQLNLSATVLLLHPAGHLVSINNAEHKLETLQLPGTPVPDADASRLLLARTSSGQGSRPGLMTSPIAAAVTPEGVIVVLEAGNNRLQAFDLGGNPVRYFGQQNSPYFLPLDATAGQRYLDLAVEFTGYLYVLAQDAATSAIRLDIYHPGQVGTTPISTTMGVNGAKLTVDFWRNLYTLNYEVLQLPGGAIPDITEPSVSLWVPSPPTTT